MRPPGRPAMPDLARLLSEANDLLAAHSLPLCERVEPVADRDTANPNVIGYAGGSRYVIKASFRHPEALERQMCLANAIAGSTGLPIPRHLCCASEGTSLPLIIMEWMPGEQLGVALRSAQPAIGAELVRDWGRCIARFHRAQLSEDVCAGWRDLAEAHEEFVRWLRADVGQRLDALEADARWSAADASAIRGYLEERDSVLDTPGVAGLVKADEGVRDALVLLDPRPHISALLDWERVTMGDTLWELASIFVRMDLYGLWPSFEQGYAEDGGSPPAPGPHSECYVMSWALIQVTSGGIPKARYERAAGIIRDLLVRGP